jgi:hypothetical protein
VKLLLAGVLAALVCAAPAAADPGPDCGLSDQRLCEPSQVHYCPDTGQMVPWLAPCPSLSIGPYLPGGLTPNGGLAQ